MSRPIKRNTKSKNKYIILTLSVLLASIFLFVGYELSATTQDSQMVVFEVESGTGSSQVIEELHENGLIRSVSLAKVYQGVFNAHGIKAGSFDLDSSWSTIKILNYISNVDHIKEESTVRLSEGIWAKDVALILSQHTKVEKDTFISLWNDRSYIESLISDYSFLQADILENKDARILLEGYLYPDTYRFSIHETEDDITRRILDNTEIKLSELLMEESSLSSYDLMTLASIVEYEAADYEDRRMVAGVFMNRLNDGKRLESSVTVCYALYEFDNWTDCEKSQPDSPYNTYLNSGLPPGPILNVSQSALKATLNYIDHDYYFFISDVCGDGSLYFAKTFEEHQVNVDKYLKDCY